MTIPRTESAKNEQERKPKSTSFRHSAGFGKRIEYWIAGLMLKEDIDVYMPLVDDNAIDAVIRRSDGTFVEIQIKARSKGVRPGDAGLFAGITHEQRSNYYFVFYSERLDEFWIMTSREFIEESHQNKRGENKGKRSICFNGTKKDRQTGKKKEYRITQFEKYLASDFSRLSES